MSQTEFPTSENHTIGVSQGPLVFPGWGGVFCIHLLCLLPILWHLRDTKFQQGIPLWPLGILVCYWVGFGFAVKRFGTRPVINTHGIVMIVVSWVEIVVFVVWLVTR